MADVKLIVCKGCENVLCQNCMVATFKAKAKKAGMSASVYLPECYLCNYEYNTYQKLFEVFMPNHKEPFECCLTQLVRLKQEPETYAAQTELVKELGRSVMKDKIQYHDAQVKKYRDVLQTLQITKPPHGKDIGDPLQHTAMQEPLTF